jgi:LysR family transcriptional activator of nhaA
MYITREVAMPNFWLNYHHLFYFKTIAEEGGVSKAAEKLRLGQPTLSAQLRQFEESLDVRLFERKHKRLILSEHGKVALEYAKNIFRTGNEMYEVLRDQKISAKIHVQIGNLDTIPKQIMLSLTKTAFKVRECFVTITEGRMDELLRELLTHRLDLMVSNFVPTSTEARGLNFRSIAKKPVAIFGSSKFRSLRRNFPQSLIGMP